MSLIFRETLEGSRKFRENSQNPFGILPIATIAPCTTVQKKDKDKLSHSLRSSSHNKFLKLFQQIKKGSTFIFFSLPRVDGFRTRENLITFVASLNIKECCKDSDKICLTDRK